jgi:outer membrane protein assembly complex protein YaeT
MKREMSGRYRPFGKTCRAVLRTALVLCIAAAGSLSADEWTVHTIRFSGNTVFTARQLLGFMETKPSHFWKKSVYSHVKLESDTAEITAAYGQKGYLDAMTGIDSIVQDTARHRVSLFISITEGPQTLVSAVAIGGTSVLRPAEELRQLQTKPNAPFSTSEIDQDARKITTDLAYRGHLYGHVADSAVVDTLAHRASVIFTIDQGPLVFAGPFQTAGLKKVRPVVVAREIKFKRGDTLTTKRIDASTQKLYATGLFNYAQIKVPPESVLVTERRRDTVTEPVTATLEEAKFLTIDASAGYGTYDGLRGSFDTRYANLFGLGHSVALDGSYNQYEQRGDLTYSYPWIFTLPVNALVTAYAQFNEITFLGGFDGIQFTVAKETNWFLSYQVWLKIERTEYLRLIQDTTGTTSLANTQSIGMDIYYDTRKLLTDTTSGAYLQISPELAGLGGRGTNQYYRALIDARGYVAPLHGFSFSSAIELGYAQGYNRPGDSVPVQIIYNLGIEGMRPVRGYDQNALSPGGGRMALVINLIQAQHIIYKWVGLLGFVDGGYAWSDPVAHHPSINDLKWTVGPGIYAKTPVGQVEFDWGYLRNPPSNGGGAVPPRWGSPYFSLGQTF